MARFPGIKAIRKKNAARCGCWLCCHSLVSDSIKTFEEHKAWMAKCAAINQDDKAGNLLRWSLWGKHRNSTDLT